jgi:RNA polymerase sigma-70 factor (ECF subfamily)
MKAVDEAMGRYAEGDARAFEVVYEAVTPLLERYLRRHLREKAQIEDIIQQTFLQMHSARGTFIVGAEVMPWAFAIARRLMIDSGRKTRREEPGEMTEDDLAATIGDVPCVASSEDLVQAQEVRARLCAAHAQLSEPQRAAFDLVKTEGLTHAQVAVILGTTVTGIKLRIHRAYLALREALGDSGPGPLARLPVRRQGAPAELSPPEEPR